MNFGLTFEYSKEMSGVVHTNTAELFLVGQDASNMMGSPAGVCYPTTTEEVQDAVRWARANGVAFIARGAGTGLAGGAIPSDGSLVISLTKMNRIRSIDTHRRTAWVEPGVLNADLSRRTLQYGLHFAPDPSSQQSCTIGGNVANNSGGPHCLSEGVTSAHILSLEVVLPSGEVCIFDNENSLFDLRGAFIGSEGMFGIATAIEVRLLQNPPHVSTMVVGFSSVHAGAMAVSAIIASGIIPSALEMMDGLEHSVSHGSREVKEIVMRYGATSFTVAQNSAERALIWKGRKTAFGAIARIQPNYYLHDTVVPRKKLAEVLARVTQIADEERLQVMNVFHAGDGNLHPILMFDKRVEGIMDRVHRAGAEIVRVSLEAGGVLSGEHGIGLEKRDFMRWMFSENDLMYQQKLRSAFDPDGISNPHKVLPRGSGCADMASIPPGSWV
jgi:glycolate oxidase